MNYNVPVPDALASAGPVMNRPDLAAVTPMTSGRNATMVEVMQAADDQLRDCLSQTDAVLSFLSGESVPPPDLNKEPACMADTALRIFEQVGAVNARLEQIRAALGCVK